MILSCNSCGKKFVVPDNAISSSGRTVQCGSCGNKWKQFPISSKEIKKTPINKKVIVKQSPTFSKTPKLKKKRVKKTREINLYSPEYLQKKHGIKLNNVEKEVSSSSSKKVSFGFYNSLIVFIVITIAILRLLYFFQDFVEQNIPFTKFYIDYLFESIKNIFEIWKNLISSY